MASQTTVVTTQVQGGSTVVTTGNREWSSGLFGCFDDCKSLWCVLCCPPCYTGQMAKRMGENCCIPICVPGGVISMRVKLRTMLGIQGSICNDCMLGQCCAPCMICQMAREMDQQGW